MGAGTGRRGAVHRRRRPRRRARGRVDGGRGRPLRDDAGERRSPAGAARRRFPLRDRRERLAIRPVARRVPDGLCVVGARVARARRPRPRVPPLSSGGDDRARRGDRRAARPRPPSGVAERRAPRSPRRMARRRHRRPTRRAAHGRRRVDLATGGAPDRSGGARPARRLDRHRRPRREPPAPMVGRPLRRPAFPAHPPTATPTALGARHASRGPPRRPRPSSGPAGTTDAARRLRPRARSPPRSRMGGHWPTALPSSRATASSPACASPTARWWRASRTRFLSSRPAATRSPSASTEPAPARRRRTPRRRPARRARPPPDGALAFVCGEPRGPTILYRWDASGARLVELRRFDIPRQVLGFGNGALAVRGACDPAAAEDTFSATGAAHEADLWCVAPPRRPWRETRIESFSRLVVLADGRTGWVRPPSAGNLTTARWVVDDHGHPVETPITFPALPADVARALARGVWVDGFEERRPGVVGGWIDAAGSLVGIEIAATGAARVGEYIRDAGAPVASGRWAFGWTASRRGFETIDGGMTWNKEIAMPDVIASGRAIRERACGPIGCVVGGWLRVGWGASEQPIAPEPPPRDPPPERDAPDLDLDCVAQGGRPPTAPPRRRAQRRPGPPAARYPTARPHREPLRRIDVGRRLGASFLRRVARPRHARGQRRRQPRDLRRPRSAACGSPLARLYAWGPESGEWDQYGRWQARWQWPWGGGQDVRASSVAPSPWSSLDAARRALGMGPGLPIAWSVVDSDDPDHALFLARHNLGSASTEVVVAEADHPPAEVHRANGEPFAEVEAAAHVGDRWYLATRESPGEGAATVLFAVDAGAAREVLRVPRVGFETRPSVHIARSADGRGLALVVDGQPDGSRGGATRWLVERRPRRPGRSAPRSRSPRWPSPTGRSHLARGTTRAGSSTCPTPGACGSTSAPIGRPGSRRRWRVCAFRVSTPASNGCSGRWTPTERRLRSSSSTRRFASEHDADRERTGARPSRSACSSARLRHALRCTLR